MPLAITRILVSGAAFSLAGVGGIAPVASPASQPAIVDSGFSSRIDISAGDERRDSCTLISKRDDLCVWDYEGQWVIGDCFDPPSPSCPT